MKKTDPFTAIADPTRRNLIEKLQETPRTVNELADGMPISRPAVSQHLKILLQSDVVSVSKDGTKRIYAINENGFEEVSVWLKRLRS